MISKRFFSLVLLIIVHYEVVFSVDETELSNLKQNTASISLSEILSTFHRESYNDVGTHMAFMLVVASYGNRLYELSVNLSAECWRTTRAHSLLLEKLAIGEETFNVLGRTANYAANYLQNQTELLEHPLEVACRQLEKRYTEDSNLRPLFEKAKKDAENFTNVSNRPPFFQTIIRSEELDLKLIEKLDVPEMAKFMVLSTFQNLERYFYYDQPISPTLFAKACREVARKEAFAESMQEIFEKTIDDILPQFMANDRVEKYTSAMKSGKYNHITYYRVWVPNLVKIFYGYVAKDPVLKKQVEDAATIMVGNQTDASKYLDFSKF